MFFKEAWVMSALFFMCIDHPGILYIVYCQGERRKYVKFPFRSAIIVLVAVLGLSACSDGGGQTSKSARPSLTGAPTATATISQKMTWLCHPGTAETVKLCTLLTAQAQLNAIDTDNDGSKDTVTFSLPHEDTVSLGIDPTTVTITSVAVSQLNTQNRWNYLPPRVLTDDYLAALDNTERKGKPDDKLVYDVDTAHPQDPIPLKGTPTAWMPYCKEECPGLANLDRKVRFDVMLDGGQFTILNLGPGDLKVLFRNGAPVKISRVYRGRTINCKLGDASSSQERIRTYGAILDEPADNCKPA